jgi:hypothetical protein
MDSKHIKIATQEQENFKEIQLSLRKSIHSEYTQRSRANEHHAQLTTKNKQKDETFNRMLV